MKEGTMYFKKFVASGNDFILFDSELVNLEGFSSSYLADLCKRKYGVGADGVLFIYFLGGNRVRMRIFNSDGSEAEMCGNGARCAVKYAADKLKCTDLILETLAGPINAWYFPKSKRVKVQLPKPQNLVRGINLECSWGNCIVDHINTGVPHTIIFVDDLENLDVVSKGREIRYHAYFRPKGTNVDFVKILSENKIRIRTYERGVESETFACGTGSVAAAILSRFVNNNLDDGLVEVYTQGGEVLYIEVYYGEDKSIKEVYLEGDAGEVFSGYLEKESV